MAIDATSLLGGALGGAALQSVLEPLLGQRHLRRDLRASALKAVTEVQHARWAPRPRDDFRRAVGDLRAQALIAGLPRRPTEVYIEAASAGRMLSERDWEETEGGDEEVPGGAIPSELARYIEACAENLVSASWRPYRARALLRFRLWKLEREKETITEELADDPRSLVNWEWVWIPQ